MGRNPRILSESGIYHIMFRGTNKQEIFLSKWDYEKFLEVLIKLKAEINFKIYAYCLMSNHVHLVLKEIGIGDISKIMQRLLTKYARWFNIKYDRTGTLLEGRYRSRAVDSDEYFLHLVRYVHQNPQKAKITETAEEYMWSSFRDYSGTDKGITDTDFLKDMLPGNEFRAFHNEQEGEDFTLFDKARSDDDLLCEMKRLGIDSVEELKYLQGVKPQEFQRVILGLRKKFSDRHIERVTGMSRFKIKGL